MPTAEPEFEATYVYDRAFARASFRRLLGRLHGGALVAVAVAALWIPWAARFPELRVFAGFVGGVAFAYLLLLVGAYRAALATADLYSSSPITVRLSHEAISVESAPSSNVTRWSVFTELVATPHELVLMRRLSRIALVVPRAALGPEGAAFVLERARQAGARVRKA